MLGNNGTEELMELVKRRSELLECLCDECKDKRALNDAVGVSRSTVDRGTRELEAVNLITWKDGEYTLTTCGHLAASIYRRYREQMQLLNDYTPLLQWIPIEAFDFELNWLTDADLYLPERGDPYAMINRHVQVINEADQYRVLLPLTGLHAHQAAHDNIVSKGGTGEAIVAPTVADTWQNDESYREYTDEMLATGRFQYSITDEPIPYFVGLFDESLVQIGVSNDEGPRALLETATDEMRSWAKEKLESYKSEVGEPDGNYASISE